MNNYLSIQEKMISKSMIWLVTGAAGFIGSNLVLRLLQLNQRVIGLDNFSTGHKRNIDEVLGQLTKDKANKFTLINGDIRDLNTCRECCHGVDIILHQAALGSVPRSIENPIATNDTNINGFLNILVAARDAKVKKLVYASSSSVYGDYPDLPKIEEKIGSPLSPYAISKHVNELYAKIFTKTYGLPTIGLRYFNVFGPRQDPNGAYAAVIPKWFSAILKQEPVFIYGDGTTSRDFCYIDNVIQANILAALVGDENCLGRVFNIACSKSTSLNELFQIIKDIVCQYKPGFNNIVPRFLDFRQGDIKDSLADINLARHLLGYNPLYSVAEGLKEAAQWYNNYFMDLEKDNKTAKH